MCVHKHTCVELYLCVFVDIYRIYIGHILSMGMLIRVEKLPKTMETKTAVSDLEPTCALRMPLYICIQIYTHTSNVPK